MQSVCCRRADATVNVQEPRNSGSLRINLIGMELRGEVLSLGNRRSPVEGRQDVFLDFAHFVYHADRIVVAVHGGVQKNCL